jgi:hypothetical protein
VPFQVALFEPVQLRPADHEILVFRLNLIYGRNVSVKGLDVGLVNHSTGGESKGVQYGLVGYIEGDMLGWQAHLVNMTRGHFIGYQSGFYNEVGTGEGFQWGFVNQASSFSGLQVSLVNVADDLYGVQVGLVNVIRSKETFAFLPIVNWNSDGARYGLPRASCRPPPPQSRWRLGTLTRTPSSSGSASGSGNSSPGFTKASISTRCCIS